MTQKEIQLLSKDLCARLPYGVKVAYFDDVHRKMIKTLTPLLLDTYYIEYKELRPYLRPMSSMTKKEEKEEPAGTSLDGFMYPDEANEYIDWLNEHHFDYRNLIGEGLALEAPEGMYKTK